MLQGMSMTSKVQGHFSSAARIPEGPGPAAELGSMSVPGNHMFTAPVYVSAFRVTNQKPFSS